MVELETKKKEVIDVLRCSIMLLIIIFLSIILNFSLKCAHCPDDGTVNFTALPDVMFERLQLPSLYVSKVLASLVVIMVCCIPFAIFGKLLLTVLVFEFAMIFCTAIGWLDGWVMMVNVFVVSALFTFNFFSNIFKGK